MNVFIGSRGNLPFYFINLPAYFVAYVFAEILIRKCLTFLMYGLDAVSLVNNSINLVTQVWNCAFRWLYGVGKFTSTRHLFDSHGTIFKIFTSL